MKRHPDLKLHIRILTRHLSSRIHLEHSLHERDDPAARGAVRRARKAIQEENKP